MSLSRCSISELVYVTGDRRVYVEIREMADCLWQFSLSKKLVIWQIHAENSHAGFLQSSGYSYVGISHPTTIPGVREPQVGFPGV